MIKEITFTDPMTGVKEIFIEITNADGSKTGMSKAVYEAQLAANEATNKL